MSSYLRVTLIYIPVMITYCEEDKQLIRYIFNILILVVMHYVNKVS